MISAQDMFRNRQRASVPLPRPTNVTGRSKNARAQGQRGGKGRGFREVCSFPDCGGSLRERRRFSSLAKLQQSARQLAQSICRFGMVHTESPFADSQHSALKRQGFAFATVLHERLGKARHAESNERMLGTKASPPDRNRPIELSARFNEIAEFAAHEGEIEDDGRHILVVATQLALAD